MDMESFSKVDVDFVIDAATDYLEKHKVWMQELKDEARQRLAAPYRHWFKTKTRTEKEIEEEIRYAEDYFNGDRWSDDCSPIEPAVWLYQGSLWRDKAQDLITLANNSMEDYIYLTAADNAFLNKYKKKE